MTATSPTPTLFAKISWMPWLVLASGIIISYLIFAHLSKLDEDKTYLRDGFEVTQTHLVILQRLTMIESHLSALSGFFLSSDEVDPYEWQTFAEKIRNPNARQAKLFNTMLKGIFYFKPNNGFKSSGCHADYAFSTYSSASALPCELLNQYMHSAPHHRPHHKIDVHSHHSTQPHNHNHPHIFSNSSDHKKGVILHWHNAENTLGEHVWYLSPIVKKIPDHPDAIIGWLLLLIDNSILFEPLGESVNKNMEIDVYLPEAHGIHRVYSYGNLASEQTPYFYLNNTSLHLPYSQIPSIPQPLNTRPSSEPTVTPQYVRIYPQLGTVTYLHNKLITLEGRVPLGDMQFIIKIQRPIEHGSTPIMATAISLIITLFITSFIWLQQRVRQRAENIAEKITQELSLSEGRLRASLDGSNDGLWDIDLLKDTVWYSPRWFTMLGYEDGELPYSRDTFDRLLHPDDRQNTIQTIQEHFSTGEPFDLQFRMQHKSGEYIWIKSRGFVKRIDNAIVRASGTHTDVTKERQYASELEEARNIAEAASRAKAEFVANMSHEIRTPLNGIIGIIELLNNTSLTPKQHQYVDILESSSTALFDIVNEILDFSKIEAGQMKIEHIGFNLEQIASSTIGVVQQYARQKQDVEIILRVSPDLPPRFIGDPARIRQCILNLMSNAAKFTHNGYVLLDIDGEKRADGNYDIIFLVRDTGIGIAPEKIGKIFQQFTQADASTTREYGGTGLGLTIVKTIVETLNGTIHVESTVGVGSCFTMRIPMPLDLAPHSQLNIHDISSLKEKYALVVDDNTANLIIFEEILLHAGMHVVPESNPERVMEHITQAAHNGTPFDFALIDFHMPEMNGKQLLTLIRAQYPELKTHFILASSAMQNHDSAQMRHLKFEGFLQKPITSSVLLPMLVAIQKLAAQNAPDIFVTRHTINEASRNAAGERNMKNLAKLRVLVVEDNLTNQQVLSWILADAGCDHKIASNGKEALDILSMDSQFDLILMDCQMPVMDGFEATRAIRSLSGDIAKVPIIALTANASRDDEQKALLAGMTSFLTKPVDINKLYNVFETIGADKSDSLPLTNSNTLDAKRLLEITGNSPERLQRFLKLFKETFVQEIAGIRNALAQNDTALMARHAHTLKGAAANLHAQDIRDAALQLETHIKTNNTANLEEELKAVEALYPAFEAAYKALIDQHS